MSSDKIWDIKRVMEILPHRYPFLMVDRVLDYEEGNFIKGYKNVSINEPYFQGHFPGEPVMPGVLQLEAMAQISAGVCDIEKYIGSVALFVSADKVKFKNVVRPGDRLDLESKFIKQVGPVVKCETKAFVDGKLSASAEITFIIQEKKINDR